MSFYKQVISDFKYCWAHSSNVGDLVCALFLFIMLLVYTLPLAPFIFLFSIPVHRGDKNE